MLEVLEKLSEVFSGEDLELCKKAYDYAKEAHENQKRASGEPYFTHPCNVALILMDLGLDAKTVSAAFLHDVLEDTPVSDSDIKDAFGEEVLMLVQGVTKLDKIIFSNYEQQEAENFRKIFVAMAKDIRVIIIKLADRLHNMRSLNYLSHERQQRFSRETIDIYAPLAGRLGIAEIKYELEDLALKYLEPEAYEYLSVNIEAKSTERQNIIDLAVADIKNILEESNIKGEVFGRAKNFYSIYAKMKRDNKTLDQIYDLFAVRVIVKTKDECYEILGKIHDKWKPVPGRIKDYIATPKPNMYQSLHTTVITDFGKNVEIQIRTYEMNRTAEFGIAAHWKYKEKVSGESDDFEKRLSWVREVMEWEGGLKDSTEFLNTLKGDIYAGGLLVFSPKGAVISLPKGAIPIDFAYAIHSEVGNKCTGAKVNDKLVPLNTELHVGDIVEIITTANGKGPSWDWLKIVKSSSAKAKIKQFFRREMKDENIKLGKQMLETEAKRRGEVLSELLTAESFDRISTKMSFSSIEELYASVGIGAVGVNSILLKLIEYNRKEAPTPQGQIINSKLRPQGGVIVKGMTGILVRYAHCCNPVPGDEIIGFISRGRGVSVHRADCPNAKMAEAERLIEVKWAEKPDSKFNASIKIVAEEESEVLSIISGLCSKMHLNLLAINGKLDIKQKRLNIDVNIALDGKEDLDMFISSLKSHEKIIDVYRTTT